jgi:general secretion pathway protein J
MRAAGFTLLEVVLALVVFSLLTLLVYGAFFLGHRAVIKGERQADINQRVRIAEDILGRQLRSTVYYFGRHDDENVAYFIGRPDGVSFVSAAPQTRGGTGLAVITYRAVDGQLLLEERTAFTPADLFDPPRDAHVAKAVLLSGFSEIAFEYMAHEDDDRRWQSQWDGREEELLPAVVRVSVAGLEFFNGAPWVRDIPLMTMVSGWGDDTFTEPPEDDEYEDEDEEEDETDDEADADFDDDEPEEADE